MQLHFLGGNVSKSAKEDGSVAKSGVTSSGVNLGLSIGGGKTESSSAVFKLSNVANLLKKYF
ncbi:hypothetical protein OX284_004125 [Flavobacterium sp. SUN046]|uniref:hypothetical protein n=1 Tax=Flavobacterium sp. SUN046 TaxID=3002440 RepID=UPI002DB90C10|nr:hypothetical protein [Flavobacterium sp. SUN046]MEC4048605.1 hypothetical protein [Flavobacterium sp. SUN046]